MKATLVLALAYLAVSGSAFAGVKKGGFGCASFMADFASAADGHGATFERPLTITRGFSGDEDGIDVRVLSTGENVEGTLKCKGDEFRRFEVRVIEPVGDKLAGIFKVYEQAALIGAFRWDRFKSQTVADAMNADAAEYLRASVQRGDTFVSGKVEYHQGDTLDLGVIRTNEDRTFILASQTDG